VDVLEKIASVILKIIVGFVLLIIAYFLVAIVLTFIPVHSDFQNQVSETEIYITSNGVHTNIIVPSQSQAFNWSTILDLDKNCQFIEFGWGEKEFYMNTPNWSDLKLGTAFKAVFLPTPAVMQIHCISHKPNTSKNTVKINLTQDQLNQLNDYIYKSFVLDESLNTIKIEPTKISNSNLRYYQANGKYSMLFTCNNWTSKGLKKVGVKNSLWAPFDKSVLFYLK